MRIFIIMIGLAVSTATAHAQRAPDMATLDRGDGISKFGFDLAFSKLHDTVYSSALRFELYGQYVTHSGLGFYAALPLAHSFGAQAPEPAPQEATSIGNLDLGGLYVMRSSRALSWVFRFGLAVPTASDDRDGVATNYLATWPRLTDLALAAPNAYYVRLGVSPLIHVDNFFIRADLGFDLGINNDDSDDGDELFRINVGAGIDLGSVALSLEIVNIATLDDFDDNDDFAHTLAFTVRFMGKRCQPFLSLGTPLDDVRHTVRFFLAGGFQVAF